MVAITVRSHGELKVALLPSGDGVPTGSAVDRISPTDGMLRRSGAESVLQEPRHSPETEEDVTTVTCFDYASTVDTCRDRREPGPRHLDGGSSSLLAPEASGARVVERSQTRLRLAEVCVRHGRAVG